MSTERRRRRGGDGPFHSHLEGSLPPFSSPAHSTAFPRALSPLAPPLLSPPGRAGHITVERGRERWGRRRFLKAEGFLSSGDSLPIRGKCQMSLFFHPLLFLLFFIVPAEKNDYVGTEAGRGCLVLPLPIGINLMLFWREWSWGLRGQRKKEQEKKKKRDNCWEKFKYIKVPCIFLTLGILTNLI